MQKFLASILPEHGVHFIAEKCPKGFIHHPCLSFDEMEARIREIDAKGLDTYFACASYQQESYVDKNGVTRQRTAENALTTKSFWLDIDCGTEKANEGKGYRTITEAGQALECFTQDLGLPRPLVVMSGSGLHIYWPLAEAIDKAKWKVTAHQLKALTQAPTRGLLADSSRTSDVASILRPVDTHNYKSGKGVPVKLLIDAPPIEPDSLITTIKNAHERLLATQDKTMSRVDFGTLRSPGCQETTENVDLIKSALAAIDHNIDYPIWRDIVFALKSTGWTCAEDLARTWSKGELG